MTVRRLNRYKVIEIRRLSGIENFASERNDFIFNPFRKFKPVKRFQNRSDMLEFWSLDNSLSNSILDVSEKGKDTNMNQTHHRPLLPCCFDLISFQNEAYVIPHSV